MRRLDATRARGTSLAAAGRVAMTIAVVGLLSASSPAGETWDGGGSDSEWSTDANWNTIRLTENPPPNDGTADIIMAGTTKLSNQVDVDWDINSLTFNNTAGAFSVNGYTGVTLGIGAGGMSNNDAQLQSLLLPIGLNTSQTWTAALGPIILASGIRSHLLLPRTLTLAGGFDTTVAGSITNNITLNKVGDGTLFLVGPDANTYAGGTSVTGGTLVLNRTGGADRAIPGNLTIGDGAGGVVRLDSANQVSEAVGNTVTVNSAGLLNLNGFNETLRDLTITGGSVTTNGGTLTVAGSLSSTGGSVTTSGGALAVAGSLSAAGGTLQFLNNASVTSGSGTIGDAAGSNGQVTVSGAGATWTNSTGLYVGNAGNGTLDVTSRGQVTSTIGYVGNQVGSVGVVNIDGFGSEWTNSSNLYVSKSGTGAMNVTGNGYVSTVNGYIGADTGSMGEVTVDGAGSTWTNTGDLFVGNAGTGTLNLQNDGRVNVSGELSIGNGSAVNLASGQLSTAFLSGGSGLNWTGGRLILASQDVIVDSVGTLGGDSLTIGSTQSLFLSNGDLYVGKTGSGTLSILEGGSIERELGMSFIGGEDGSSGSVVVDGLLLGEYRSNWETGQLFVGHYGDGSLEITNGASVLTVEGPGELNFINYGGDGTSSVRVEGESSDWFLGALAVGAGAGGHGLLGVFNGGDVASGPAFVGFMPDSEGSATVDGTDSSWSIGGAGVIPGVLTIGILDSAGVLEITNGGLVTDDIGRIGGEGSTGMVRVSGGDSRWINTAELNVGFDGEGTLHVLDGSLVESPVASIGVSENSVGEVWVDGSSSVLRISQQMRVGELGQGRLIVTASGEVRTTELLIGQFGELGGDGLVEADVENGGLVSPGTSPGALNVEGNYTQTADGELLIELAASGYDQLLVTGDAALAGTLTVNVIDGFTPTVGRSFTILTADDVDGAFSTEMLPSLPGLNLDVIYNPTSVVLMVSSAGVPGDYNQNGTVDAADYVVWRKTDGTEMGYDTWRTNFGRMTGSGVGATGSAGAVPEPISLVLIMLASVSMCTRLLCGRKD